MLTLASCAPQAFVVNPEMRAPSKSGLNLSGKSMAVVYLTDGNPRDTTFNSFFTTGFATRLEEDYFGGNQEVDLLKMKYHRGGDYASKDSLVNLVMDSGKDVVFLFERPAFGSPTVSEPMKVTDRNLPADSAYVSTVKIPFTTKVYVYDSMNKEDKVLAYSGSKDISVNAYGNGKASKAELALSAWTGMGPGAEAAGYKAAESFVSIWKGDAFQVIYYDWGEGAWEKGAEYAYSFKWKDAVAQWLKLVNHRNAEKRACACYNIGLGCFMMGQPELALEWLDRSDKEHPVSLTKSLRTKIKTYSGR